MGPLFDVPPEGTSDDAGGCPHARDFTMAVRRSERPHISRTKPAVSLHQSTSKPQVVPMIDALLDELGLEHNRYVTERTGSGMSVAGGPTYLRNGDMITWQINGYAAAAVRDVIHRGWRRRHSTKRSYRNRTHGAWRDGEWVRIDGWKDIEHRERIPRWVLERASRPQLIALLRGLMAGDGTWPDGDTDGHSSGLYYTSSPRLADDVQELLALIGYRNQITPHREGQLQISFTKRATVTLNRDDAITEDGQSPSWCLTTDFGNVVMRRAGSTFIAGNTVDDFGVIAVLDQRLATAGYRGTRFPGGMPAIPWLRHRLAQAGR
jgi:hypothetical protein